MLQTEMQQYRLYDKHTTVSLLLNRHQFDTAATFTAGSEMEQHWLPFLQVNSVIHTLK